MENTAQSGMIEFEQLCEKLLEEQDIPENIKMWFQVNILDAAQNIFEKQRVTKDEAIREIEEYIRDADKAISEDEEYIRGWKSALLVVLEVITKLGT